MSHRHGPEQGGPHSEVPSRGWFQTIADIDATAEEAHDLAAATLAWLVEEGIALPEGSDCVLSGEGHVPEAHYGDAVSAPDPYLRDLRTNGLQVITAKAVSFSTGADRISCLHCHSATQLVSDRGNPSTPGSRYRRPSTRGTPGRTGTSPVRHAGMRPS
jgi:hypothetical protein